MAVLGLLIVISPGADFVLVLRNSLHQGRTTGLWTAIGISLGITVHICYSTLGIGYLISHNELLFNVIRYAGAGYLIYLGIKGLLSKKHAIDILNTPSQSSTKFNAMAQGFFCNVLNPKTMLFFLSVFSQLLTLDKTSQFEALLYGLYMVILHACWFGIVAILFTSRPLQNQLNRMQQKINQACGAGLVIFGIVLGLKT